MDGRCFTLVTIPLLQQAATTGESIFEPPSNTMVQAQPEFGQSQQIQNFCTLCTPVGRNALTTISLQTTQNAQNQKKIGMERSKQKQKVCKEEESIDSEQKELNEDLKLIACQALITPVSTQVLTVMALFPYSLTHWCHNQKKKKN